MTHSVLTAFKLTRPEKVIFVREFESPDRLHSRAPWFKCARFELDSRSFWGSFYFRAHPPIPPRGACGKKTAHPGIKRARKVNARENKAGCVGGSGRERPADDNTFKVVGPTFNHCGDGSRQAGVPQWLSATRPGAPTSAGHCFQSGPHFAPVRRKGPHATERASIRHDATAAPNRSPWAIFAEMRHLFHMNRYFRRKIGNLGHLEQPR